MKNYFFVFALIMVIILAGCASEEEGPVIAFASLPVGNAATGERLYYERINTQPRCSDCHSLDGSPNIGPTLLGYAKIAGERVANQSAEEYSLQSIVRPWVYVVDGYNNIMPTRYTHTLTDQQLADLIAFMLTQ
jgi:mono/diheme cytochrome c family protein